MARVDFFPNATARRRFWPKWSRLYWQTVPVTLLLVAFFVVPVVMLLGISFLDGRGLPSIEHYRRLVEVPLYGKVLLTTLNVAFWTTLLSVVGAYPVAYLLAISRGSTRNWLIILVLLPFWTSFLVRTFAWIVLLGRKGAVNQMLMAIGITDAPLQMIYNFTGVMIGMTHALMPLATLTLLAVMEGIDPNLTKAASTMGAKGGTRFWRIYFPLTMPGVASAALLVFITSLGFFITPALLGGPQDTMIVQLIIFQIREVLNWQFAGAIGVLLVITFMVIFFFYDRVFGLSVMGGGARAPKPAPRSSIRRCCAHVGKTITRALAYVTDALIGICSTPRMTRKSGAAGSRAGLYLVCTLILGFLALPTLFVLPVSFTSEAFLTWPPTLFSLQWYRLVFDSPVWLHAAARSFAVALVTATVAMLIALPCTFALSRNNFAGKSALFGLVVAPMIVPNIFIAVGLFFLFSRLGIAGTTFGVILGHTVIVIPYVIVTVLAILKGYDRNLDHAAATMGASGVETFRRVTFPLIRSGVTASFMFAFIISFDELTIALFVTGGRITTLPKLMYEDALLSVSPRLAAVASLLLVLMSILILISELTRRKGGTRLGK
ncbi:putative spermidine/putrescine transport system permease protein [Xaviernesmea oryzae]|uniref:Putative spermidine/putrescine transport system permease protein n=1 Tax=Xaviernesmea oryzae TaxID=464029 RepID=A0A1X7FW90_9HYPH|nr:ABC transporter permease subunit [Xaviernesmea oryzae]SMF59291.1 putative spermidine/putrescine transport system permease protein [Xaviernesmea oryzae]